jgi:radical SAM-linked protein
MRVAGDVSPDEQSCRLSGETRVGDAGANRIRLRFWKTGRMRLLSHLEMINLFSRAISRAAIPVRFSQGFHPHPRFSFATALSVGVESYAEYMDMEVAGDCSAARVMAGLNTVLPDGVKVVSAEEIPLKGPSLSVIIEAVRYRVTSEALAGIDMSARIEAFMAMETFPWRREKRGKVLDLDLRLELRDVTVSGASLELLVGRGKPLEFVSAITGVQPDRLTGSRIEKLDVVFTPTEPLIFNSN